MDELQVTHRQYVQEAGVEGQTPLLKVHLFGSFRLYWQVPPGTQENLWDSRTSARSLFKLLLCMPERQAAKSLLAGILWPETDEEKALASLRSAVKVLRKVLCTATGEMLIEQQSNGGMLKLVEQRRLWVDTDAFEVCVARTSRTTTADEELALWQQARTLLRGEFLAEDQQYEWFGSRPVKLRRQTLWMARSRMIRHLADLYIQRGEIALAEEELEQHIARFPTDQDALYRLLTLLEQQSCFEQATILYTRMKHILEATGKQPAKHVRAVYERIQQSITALQQASPTRPLELSRGAERGKQPRPHPLTLVATQAVSEVVSDTLSSDLTGRTGNRLFTFATDESFHTVIAMLQSLSQREGIPEIAQLARRQLLQLNIAFCMTRLAQLDNKRLSAIEREELSNALGESIADSWKLFLSLPASEVQVIGHFQLSLIHQVHSLLPSATLPYFYSGVYDLLGILFHFQNRAEEALRMYHAGYLATLAIDNPWYVAKNLICQAHTYLTFGHQAEALQLLEGSLTHLGDTDEDHRRTKAHALACEADALMMLRRHTEACKKLDNALPYLDKMAMAEEFDYASWLQLAGKNALMANNFTQAITYLEEALKITPTRWLARQVGVFIPLAMAYARLQEREKSLFIAKQGISAISTFNAPLTNQYFLEYIRGDMLERFSYSTEIQTFLTDALRQLPQFSNFIDLQLSANLTK